MNTPTLGASRLGRIFASVPSQAERAAEVEGRAIRLGWSRGNQLITEVLPIMAEIAKGRLPEVVDKRPRGIHASYGFDGEGRCVWARLHVPGADDFQAGIVYEAIEYQGIDRLITRYEYDGLEWTVVSVRYQQFRGDDMLLQEDYHRFAGYSGIAFTYRDHLPVERLRWESSDTTPTQIEEVRRDDSGEIVEIVAGDITAWSATSTRRSEPSEVVAQIVESIAATLRARSGDQPWLIWLRYTGDGADWADAAWPRLSIASDADNGRRKQTAAETWRQTWDWLDWNVPELEVPASAKDIEALNSLDDVMPLEDVGRLLRDVAARLSQMSDPQAIYIAIDDDLVDIGSALAALSEAEFKALVAAGMVPPAGEGAPSLE